MDELEKKYKKIVEMIADLDRPTKILNAWEEGFVANITEQFSKRGSLTEFQYEKLLDIWHKKG